MIHKLLLIFNLEKRNEERKKNPRQAEKDKRYFRSPKKLVDFGINLIQNNTLNYMNQ